MIDGFRKSRNIAMKNHNDVQPEDFVLCLLYGDKEHWNGNIKLLHKIHPVYSGEDFWHRLTGDKDFMVKLLTAVEEVVEELEPKKNLQETIDKLAIDIKKEFK